MRALFGLIQLALGVAGVIALFNGQWLLTVVAWAGALTVGWIGNRIVKRALGISQTGQEALALLPQAVEHLSNGSYTAAEGVSLGAVNAFRMGRDDGLLPMALLLRSVALGANGKLDQARACVDEAERRCRALPDRFREANDEFLPMILHVQQELHSAQPNSSRLVAEFLEMNAS